MSLPGPLSSEKLCCLIDALAWCPRLDMVSLLMRHSGRGEGNGAVLPISDVRSFAKLCSLTELTLAFSRQEPRTLATVVDALVSLTGLAHLHISFPKPAVLPAALAQLKGFRWLGLLDMPSCAFEAGCLDLPSLLSLYFQRCCFEDRQVLLGVTALKSLTCIEFTGGQGPRFFDPQLVNLSRLQRMVFNSDGPCNGGARLGRPRLPSDMGSLSLTLLHLDFWGHELAQFPLIVTQLVALESLVAGCTEFAELPAAITALSRLTELRLGRVLCRPDSQLEHEKRPLNARALGDLSGFPALCMLEFASCEVTLCDSFLSSVGHASLASLSFYFAHPAPECALVVLQLSQALRRLGRGDMLKVFDDIESEGRLDEHASQNAQALPPFYKFKVALGACGM